MSKPTLIIHGASSFTARQLLTYLDEHRDADHFEFILAGRSQDKLEKANQRLKKQREIAIVDLEDEQSVRQLVEKGKVVVNLAGPFRWYHAEALVKECASAGKDYIDLTGETAWLANEIVPKYNYLASKTGARIVPSCGFDSIPSDIVQYSALSFLQQKHPDLSVTKSTSMFKVRATLSGGSVASMFSIFDLPPAERRMGEWSQTPIKGASKQLKPLYTMSHPLLPFPPKIGSAFVMYPFNRTIIRRSWYLSRLPDNIRDYTDTEDAHSGKPTDSIQPDEVLREGKHHLGEPIHGNGFVYEEGLEMKSRWMAFAFSIGMGLFFTLMGLSALFRKLVKTLVPKQGTGASDETLQKGFVKVTNLSLTQDPNVAVLTTYKGEGDPGYWHTCHLLAESALALALPVPKGEHLPPLSLRGGCLTPATAMGSVLLNRLNRSGKVQVKSEFLVRGGESKKDR